jgi:putative transposase
MDRGEILDSPHEKRNHEGVMATFILCVVRYVRLLGSGYEAMGVENFALRQQLAVFKRQHKRPRLNSMDRFFWVGLSQLWSGWRGALILVQPDTVVRWQRERFRRFWGHLSKAKTRRRGRPSTAKEIRQLILQIAVANPLWRAPRIHGELKMLGIKVSERTVSRILRGQPRPPSQTWKTFLKNHVGEIVSVDFFTVPTVTLHVLYVFVVLEHRRREVLHFNVTDHPTAEWASQQLMEAFAYRDAPRYLIRDRDSIYQGDSQRRVRSLRISEVVTAPQSPWQNPYAERLIGSIRRECLNHFVVLNARHLKRILRSYFDYYHQSRTHLGLGKECPVARPVMETGRIIEIPQLGGLHHRYARLAV